jgi:hypothetical protein
VGVPGLVLFPLEQGMVSGLASIKEEPWFIGDNRWIASVSASRMASFM